MTRGLHETPAAAPVSPFAAIRSIETIRPVEAPPPPRSVPAPSRRGWIPAGETVEVAGRRIGGMVYLGPLPGPTAYGPPSRGTIDPSLPVARLGDDREARDLPYWPNYAQVSPRARATYLDWLAGGREDAGIGVGYVFMFFYGLERRFFVDAPSRQEQDIIIAEVERLLALFGENWSVKSYLGRFLEAARPTMGGEMTIGFTPDQRTGALPLPFQIALSQMLARGETLGSDHVLAWYVHHPETSLRTAIRRVFPEFRAMFAQLFRARYPEGLKVSLPRKKLRPNYQAASGEFTLDLSDRFGDVRDLGTQRKPLDVAQALAEEACAALDRFSRLVGKDESLRGTLAGWLALPPAIRAEFPCPQGDVARAWGERAVEAGGLVSAAEMFQQLGAGEPENPGKREFTEAKAALAGLGLGLAPDPDHGIRRPKPDEPVALFRLPEPGRGLERASTGHGAAQLSILLGSFVAQADGQVREKERAVLGALIEMAGLAAIEAAHLQASLTWALAVPSDLSLLTRRMKDAGTNVKRELGRLAIFLAAADGTIDPKEVAAVERLHRALGLDAVNIYAELHALAGPAEPVTVRPAEAGEQGRRIPAPPGPGEPIRPGLRLDRDRISAVMANTVHVSKVLGEIFAEDEPAVLPEAEPAPEPDEAGSFEGLDPACRVFLEELLGRDHWPEEDFAALASRHRLMAGGAAEVLNDWAFERFGTALLEEYDGYEIDKDLARRLRA